MIARRHTVRHGAIRIATLATILVGTVLVLLLAGLLLSGLCKVRESAARASSANNLGQFAKGFHNFESAFYRLPPALVGGYRAAEGDEEDEADTFLPIAGAGVKFVGGAGVVVSELFPFSALNTHGLVLPYMLGCSGQPPSYNGMKSPNFSTDVRGVPQSIFLFYPRYPAAATSTTFRVSPRPYFSPADPSVSSGLNTSSAISSRILPAGAPAADQSTSPPSGATSYAANFKVFGVLSKDETAVTSLDRASTIADIPDGSSNTVFMAEKYGTCTASAPIPNAPTNQGIPVQPAGSGGSLWAEPNLNENAPFFAYPQGGNDTYTAGPGLKFQVQPNPFNTKCNPFRASTPHLGGILVLMGDGSVRTVAPSISDQTWYRAVTPNDGQQLGDDW